MTSKQFFSLSLVVLSIIMGLDWYKNKPVVTKKKAQTRVSVPLDEVFDDLDEFDDDFDDDFDDAFEDDMDDSEKEDSKKEAIAKGEGEGSEDKPEEKSEPEHEDEVLAYFASLKNTPFEPSPYMKLIEEIKAKEQEQIVALNRPKSTSETVRLNAIYSASIVIGSQLVAVIDSKTYRVGEIFEDMKITDISQQLVVLNKGINKYLIPKRGVELDISEDGSYSINDTFLDN